MKQSIEKGSMPEPSTSPERAEMFRMGVDILSSHKVGRLSVSHWGRDSRERNINNLGVKSGAGGNFAGHNAMSLRKLPAYYQALDAGKKPLLGTIGAGFDRGWLEIDKLNHVGGEGMSDHCMPLFAAWQDNGLATIHQGIFDLTLPGQFWNVTMHRALINFLERFEHHPLKGQNTEKAA